jgi:hypothetical protein
MSKRHPFHALCPYFAMFPEEFVENQLLSFTSPGSIVFDPFCGRGTTVFESLLRGRNAYGSDINPVAACIASAKAAAPTLAQVLTRLDELESEFQMEPRVTEPPTPFFEACFHRETLSEILFIRNQLDWRSSATDCFITAMALGVLHGESHRTAYCLSNRMPRTISTKPEYSMRWWAGRGLTPPRRETFNVLRKAAAFRYRMPPAALAGVVRQVDARNVGVAFPELWGRVQLVVTSPPYLDTTDYAEDQWLRLWFLGGEPRPVLRQNRDDRHRRVDEYWRFLTEAWAGLDPLLSETAVIVIRIGGARLSKSELLEGVTGTLSSAINAGCIVSLHGGVTSQVRPRETSAFRPAPARPSVEHDFVYRICR